ncbi:MAG: 3-hydroxyacyl-ACP dehydratase FabZ [Halarsenatibacteraceae bacterium]
MEFNIEEIQEFLPHRYPLLLIDRVLEMEEGKFIKAIKNVTINEEFFQGHFPGHPIMPGVLIVEAMAQAGGVLLYKSGAGDKGSISYFAAIKEAKFRKPVVPGDTLVIECEILRMRRSLSKIKAKATVKDQVAAEAELTFATRE